MMRGWAFADALLLTAAAFGGLGCLEDTPDLPVVPVVPEPECPSGPPAVDIVVLVDNSGSMRQEQTELARTFPIVLRELMDPADGDGDGAPDHPAVTDVNVGVISPDMGTAGHVVSTCSDPDSGDDGCFLGPGGAAPACGGVPYAGLDPAGAPVLRRNAANADAYPIEQLGREFGCLATLGTNGCGFEQQLGAVRRAVVDQTAPGGCNKAFLRPDSIVVVVVVTDEDDCSVNADGGAMFDTDRTDLGHLCLRCFLHPEFLEEASVLAAAVRGVRPERPSEDVLLAAIVGVPTAAEAPECNATGESASACLAVPAMIPTVDPAMTTQLIPSCNTSNGLAFPPARIVRFAEEFGSRAIVRSICSLDWTPTMEDLAQLVVARVAERFPGPDPRCAADEQP
jgi:hypothetical protein